MSSSLERMGDLSAHIALTARRSHPEPTVPAQHREQIARMGELAATAVHEAAVVIAERDLDLAARVEDNDSQLDELQREIARELARSEGFPNRQIVDMNLLIRIYEQLRADAVSMARRVGLLATGDSVDTLDSATDVDEF